MDRIASDWYSACIGVCPSDCVYQGLFQSLLSRVVGLKAETPRLGENSIEKA